MASTDHGELLTKFEEIFGSLVEHEVIKMVLQSCDWDSNSAQSMILSMIDKQDLPPHIRIAVEANSVVSEAAFNLMPAVLDGDSSFTSNSDLMTFERTSERSDNSDGNVSSPEREIVLPVSRENSPALSVSSDMSLNKSLNGPTPRSYSRTSTITPFAMAQSSIANKPYLSNDLQPSFDNEGENANTESHPDLDGDASLPCSPFKPSAPAINSENNAFNAFSQWVLAPEFVPNTSNRSARASFPFNAGIWPVRPNTNFTDLDQKLNLPVPLESSPQRPKAKVKSKKEEIIHKILYGEKIMVIMRGLPGSGKSSLARRIKGNSGVILSADDFFIDKQGRYRYNPGRIPEAHAWTKNQTRLRLREKRSPIIIDNTNTQVWEMKPYVKLALQYGYDVDMLEPETTWKFDVRELAKKNTHGVPKDKIREMKERYEGNIIIEEIIASIGDVRSAAKEANCVDDREVSPGKKIEWFNTMPDIDADEGISSEMRTENSHFVDKGSPECDTYSRYSEGEVKAQSISESKSLEGGIPDNALSLLQAYKGSEDDDDADVIIEDDSDSSDICGAAGVDNGLSDVENSPGKIGNKDSGKNISLMCSENSIDSGDLFNETSLDGHISAEDSSVQELAIDMQESDQANTTAKNNIEKDDSEPQDEENVKSSVENDVEPQDEENVKALIEEACKSIDVDDGEEWDHLVRNAGEGEEELNEEMFNELVENFGSSLRIELDKKEKENSGANETLVNGSQEDYTDDVAMYEFCNDMEDKIGQSLSSVITKQNECSDSSLFSIVNLDSVEPADSKKICDEDSVCSESQTNTKCEILSDKNDNVILTSNGKCDSDSEGVVLNAIDSNPLLNDSDLEGKTLDPVMDHSVKDIAEEVHQENTNDSIAEDKETETVDSEENETPSPQKADCSTGESDNATSMASWDCPEMKDCVSMNDWDDNEDSTSEVDQKTPKPTRDSRRRVTGDPQKWMSADTEVNSTKDLDLCSWEPVAEGAIKSWEDGDQAKTPPSNTVMDKKLLSHTGAVPKMRQSDFKQSYSPTRGELKMDSTSNAVADNEYILPILPSSGKLIGHGGGSAALSILKEKCEVETQTLSIDFQALEMDNNLYEMKILYAQPNYIPVNSEGMILESGPLTKGRLTLDKGTMTDEKTDVRAVRPLQNLVAFFPSIPESHLKDVLEKCKFDLDWAMNVLLDGGYEMADSVEVCNSPESTDNEMEPPEANSEESNTANDIHGGVVGVSSTDVGRDVQIEERRRRLKQSQVKEDLVNKKEIENSFTFPESVDDRVTRLTGRDFENLNVSKVKHKKTKKKTGKKKHSGDSSLKDDANWEDGEGAQFVTLVMDPLFASQLMSMFGPIGSCGMSGELAPEDRSVILPLELCHQIHKYWTKTLDGKFKHEAEVLDSMLREDENLARQLQEEEEKASKMSNLGADLSALDPTEKIFEVDPPTNLKEIMDLEQALQVSKNDRNNGNGQLLSSQLSLQRLHQKYPHVDQDFVKQEFEDTSFDYQCTMQRISSRFGNEQAVPKTVIAPELLEHYEEQRARALEVAPAAMEEEDHSDEVIEPDDPQVYRDEAQMHYFERQKCYRKAQEAHQQGMKAVAVYYATIGKKHSEMLKEANERASQKILEAVNASKKDANTLDLHLLHVPEALKATQEFLSERKQLLASKNINRMHISLITGRGAHSVGGQARLKPAIEDFLRKSGYHYNEVNSGMLDVTLQR